MGAPISGWSNKGGTVSRGCSCGTWKEHWKNISKKPWPSRCSVDNCSKAPTLGGHVINRRHDGEQIIPLCDSCNKVSVEFALKEGITLVSANKAQTCEKY